MRGPLIGIAMDIVEVGGGAPRAQCSLAYADAVVRAGGVPVFLPAVMGQIGEQAGTLDGFILTGGDDPRTEPFGVPTHPQASPLHPRRQEYDVALLRVLFERPEKPVLGICLGMQLMALVSGGALDQHLPDTLATAARHAGGNTHGVVSGSEIAGADAFNGAVSSHHRQAVSDPGRLRVVARSDDGVIEAVTRDGCAFCMGVQWHPERTGDPALGDGVFARLVKAAAVHTGRATGPRSSRGNPA